MPQNRRTFLTTLCGAALGLSGSRAFSAATVGPSLAPIGLQLYTVREEMRRDVPGTLERVAAIGYREVEFAGYFGHAPAEIRGLLARFGLTAPSTHVGFDTLGDGWRATLEQANEAGHSWVTVPWIPADARTDLDGWRRVAELFNRSGEAARAAGLRFAYHNHDFEFVETGGGVPLYLLLEETEPSLVDFQLDLYWITRAGHDLFEAFRRHPGRFPMVHVKDSTGPPDHRMVDVGQGTIDFARVLAERELAGIRHFFVEHDRPDDPLGSARASFAYLSRLRS